MVKELIQYLTSRKYRDIKCSTTDGRNYILSFVIYDVGKISFTFVDEQSSTNKTICATIDNCVMAYKNFGMVLVPNRRRPEPVEIDEDDYDEDDE